MATPPPKIEPLIVPRAPAQRARKRPVGWIIAGLVVIALILSVVLTARSGDVDLYPGPARQAKTTLYLIDNGFHSDLVFPRAALFARPHPTALATAMATDKPWIAIGWGDAKFFTARGSGVALALAGLRALTPPGHRSAVRIEGLPASPDRLYADAHPIQVTSAGLERAIARIDESFERDADGQPQRVEAPHETDTGFFQSVERFNLAHLCNHWTAEVLNAAGLPVTPVLDTLPMGLRLDLKMRAGVR